MAWNLIAQSEDEYRYYNHLRNVWINSQPALPENRVQSSWKRIKSKTLDLYESSKPVYLFKSKSVTGMVLKAAAFVILIAGIQILLSVLINSGKVEGTIVVEAPKGAKTFLTLDDGSKIWLNAGSKLQYNKTYNSKDRNVTLEGEAFFQVSKNKHLPFKVLAQGVEVKALGTSFNVNAYPEDGYVQTTLVEGSVVVSSIKDGSKEPPVILKPSQSVTVYTREIENKREKIADTMMVAKTPGKIDIRKNVDVKKFISWKEKRWVFEREYISNLTSKLERRYDVKIIVLDEELNNYKISGILEDETLDQILSAIRLTVPMDFKINGDTVQLSLNKELKKKYYRFLNIN
ncbi:MAG TPA: FecR domain-containing protein [Bacteroidales bacterium]|nr:FecR domain-containing protein [Bacteroidales bacterium]